MVKFNKKHLNSAESWYIMAIRNILGVNFTFEVKRTESPCGKFWLVTANGITVKVLKHDWLMLTIGAPAFIG